MKVYAYLRVSTGKQDLQNQQFAILKYCEQNNIQIDEWVEETVSGGKDYKNRKLGKLIDKCNAGDVIICSEISRLGRSMFMILDLLHIFLDKGIEVRALKENLTLIDDLQSRVLCFAFGIAAEVEKSMISERTREALAKKKAEGVKLGRPVGSKNKKVKLSGKEIAIQTLLEEGHSYAEIARLLHVDRSTLCRFVKNHMSEQEIVS